MSYGLNFGFGMPMMNFNMMSPMTFGMGNQMDNWQYSYFAGPGKSSVSYPVDQLSVQNDMAIKNFVDSTYSMLPQMQNFYAQMCMKMQEWFNNFNEEMKKQAEEAKERALRERAERQAAEDDQNIDPTHDTDKKKPTTPTPVEQTPSEEDTPPVETPVEEAPVETTPAEETPEVSDKGEVETEVVEEPEPTGDRSYRGTLDDPSTFDEKNDSIAKGLYDAMKGPGTWTKDFNNAMHEISPENVVEVMEAYKENYAPHMKEYGFFGTKDYNLIDSIVGDFSGKELNDNINYLGNKLIDRAKALTDKVNDCGDVVEDPKVIAFREELQKFLEVYDETGKDDIKYRFEEFKNWIRELENTKNTRIIMDTNAKKTA